VPITFFAGGPKFTKLFLFNAGKIIVDNSVFHLSTFLWVPEIFAVKVESCLELHQILDIFCPPEFQGSGAPEKIVLVLSLPPSGTSSGKVSWGYSPNPQR